MLQGSEEPACHQPRSAPVFLSAQQNPMRAGGLECKEAAEQRAEDPRLGRMEPPPSRGADLPRALTCLQPAQPRALHPPAAAPIWRPRSHRRGAGGAAQMCPARIGPRGADVGALLGALLGGGDAPASRQQLRAGGMRGAGGRTARGRDARRGSGRAGGEGIAMGQGVHGGSGWMHRAKGVGARGARGLARAGQGDALGTGAWMPRRKQEALALGQDGPGLGTWEVLGPCSRVGVGGSWRLPLSPAQDCEASPLGTSCQARLSPKPLA